MRILRVSILVLMLVLWGCTSHENLEPPDNPFDPGNPNYVSPTVEIINGPNESEIVEVTTVTFEWQGNESATEYHYKFDSPNWSDWDESTSKTFDYLDEGIHSFEIQARSVNGDKQVDSLRLEFEVDAVEGISLVAYPYSQEVEVGDTIMVSINILDVENIVALGFELSFSADMIRFMDFMNGEIIDEWGGLPLVIVDSRLDETFSDINIAITSVEGNVHGFSGSIPAIYLRFIVQHQGEFWLSPSNVLLLDPEQQSLQISTMRGCKINAN